MNQKQNSLRTRCVHCDFPLRVCICKHICQIESNIKVFILQHPSEANVAKNTAKLVNLTLTSAQVIVGETPADFAAVIASIQPEYTYLIYPGEAAISVETFSPSTMPAPKCLIFLDGTWKKTYRLMQSNPWLSSLKQISFSKAPKTRYQIRKAHREDSLSTIEAVAYSLQQLEKISPLPFMKILDAMIETQMAFMPEEVKKRYSS
ncbi:tRNA-uridine aminocarboxypropyltransferase [Algicola sagamiensis]|uniref:tRNA-uridine aminocarboxypropyltransferase n=1 Tax=Algicola sagamiensis TaxID=163869 RepID=UPI0003A801A2|nr:tRNA-uridine aminocarboxypropyltransferase [Algicola sagamiensis]